MFDWIHGNSRLPIALSIVELLVDMDCQGCEKKVRRAISKLYGVDTIEVDMDQQKVTVTGYVDREDVLKMVKRTGRMVEFWPFTYNGYYGDYHTNPSSQYLEQSNYQKMNYADNTFSYEEFQVIEQEPISYNINGYYYTRPSQKIPPRLDENDLHLFSDDNVHACAVM